MKKIISILILVFGVNCFANKLIYCPERIECSGNTIESCRSLGGGGDIFLRMIGSHVSKATYLLAQASGLYQLDNEPLPEETYPTCYYDYHPHSRITHRIYLMTPEKSRYKLTLYFEDTDMNKWVIPPGGGGVCKSSNPQDCPFKADG